MNQCERTVNQKMIGAKYCSSVNLQLSCGEQEEEFGYAGDREKWLRVGGIGNCRWVRWDCYNTVCGWLMVSEWKDSAAGCRR